MVMKLYAGPTVNAVTVEEAKLQVRQDASADDDLILGLIELAQSYVEDVCDAALVNQTWDMFLDGFPGSVLEIPKWPLVSVTGVYYTAEGASEATYSSANYVVDVYNKPGKIKLVSSASWPGDELVVVNGVRVRFVAGYGTGGSAVPRRMRQAMLLLIGHWYENREETWEKRLESIPMGVESLLWEYRRGWWGFEEAGSGGTVVPLWLIAGRKNKRMR